jgi:hypothetical protein
MLLCLSVVFLNVRRELALQRQEHQFKVAQDLAQHRNRVDRDEAALQDRNTSLNRNDNSLRLRSVRLKLISNIKSSSSNNNNNNSRFNNSSISSKSNKTMLLRVPVSNSWTPAQQLQAELAAVTLERDAIKQTRLDQQQQPQPQQQQQQQQQQPQHPQHNNQLEHLLAQEHYQSLIAAASDPILAAHDDLSLINQPPVLSPNVVLAKIDTQFVQSWRNAQQMKRIGDALAVADADLVRARRHLHRRWLKLKLCCACAKPSG